ncbi:AAA family ATPase [Methylophilaceae bacterium]|nr:AAA family ATPase [Methylophilaceae bacterium]
MQLTKVDGMKPQGKAWHPSLDELLSPILQVVQRKEDASGTLYAKAKDNYRKKENIEEMYGVVLDIDKSPTDVLPMLVEALQSYQGYINTTFSHDPRHEKYCYRAFIKSESPIKPEDYEGGFINLVNSNPILSELKEKGILDMSAKDIGRFFYDFSCPPSRENDAYFHALEGIPLIPDTRKQSTEGTFRISESGVVQRNVTLTKEVGRLVQEHKHKPTVVKEALVFNEKFVPPLDIKEAMTVINSIWKKHFKDNPEDTPITEITSGRRSYKLKELKNLPKVEWLVDGVLANKGIATIYGASGSSKSFLAIDLCMNLALGNAWFEIPVITKIPVVYVALEGFTGVAKRLQGWCQHYKWYPNNLEITKDELLLAENKSVDEFISFYKGREFSGGIVIIDTLNNACPNIDENHAGAMGGVIYNIKRIQKELDCTVLIIHHSGKNEENGMRGSSSLKASMDSVLHVTQSKAGLCHWVLEKSKDSECGVGYSYRLEEIEINDETTCVIRKVGGHETTFKKQSLGTNQGRVFELLKERIKATFSQDEDIEITIRDVAAKWTEQPSNKRTHLIRSNISKLVEYGLVETGLREQNQDRIWITEKGMSQ